MSGLAPNPDPSEPMPDLEAPDLEAIATAVILALDVP